uniref:Uncharacterized protein LOC105031974 isoform X2 n=1 Tax=Elaeis guineensis var. tenera TaxID=51953 RepID=A0A6I9Q897_ELAGV|nr:uncharacterized protein LOC105031974 isoform X2 [Elaeis guineensis]
MRGSAGASGGRGRASREKYRNPCLTMHQPWASLLVHGIKRIEGRSWPAPLTGRLWIHAASKVPDAETIKAMEEFYREIYATNGITDIKFPEHYPVSRLLGCVEVVGCLKSEELVCWEALPESVRLEGLTDFCWLCQNPQKLLVPFEMRGYQGVYNLEKRIYEAAVRGLCPVQCPQPVKFPLPDPQDPLSLRPGSLASYFSSSKTSTAETPPSVSAAIAGARAAAAQFSKKDQSKGTSSNQIDVIQKSEHEFTGTSLNITTEDGRLYWFPNGRSHRGYQTRNHKEQKTTPENREHSRGRTKEFSSDLILQPGASSKQHWKD